MGEKISTSSVCAAALTAGDRLPLAPSAGPRIPDQLGLQPLDRLLPMAAITAIIPYSRQQIYKKIANGSFPPPIKIGSGRKGRVAWRQSVIVRWMAEQTQQSEAA